MSDYPKSELAHSCWDLCSASDDVLAGYDIVALNLAASLGLPGTEGIDPASYFDKLDDWADRVKHETLRHMYRFDPQSNQPPSEQNYGNSFGCFCCYFLLQVLQQDCGVIYNPARKFDPDFHDPADVFVHGILDEKGQGGTCASMPVVYVSVARRLGYPVKLVQTKEHLFFRWEDPCGTQVEWDHPKTEFWIPPDRFNVEGSGEGIAFYDDSHYTQWPHIWKESDFEHKRYLRSLTDKEELADFLVQRGECQWELGQRGESLKAYYFARQLAPDDPRYEWLHAYRSHQLDRRNAEQREWLREINEQSRLAHAHRESKQLSLPTIPQPVKVALGTAPPKDLPPGTPIQYVSPEEAAPTLPVGRPLRVAAGQPLPTHLPPGTPVQVVPPEMADPLPPVSVQPQMHLPFTSAEQAASVSEQAIRIQEGNRRIRAQQSLIQTLRLS